MKILMVRHAKALDRDAWSAQQKKDMDRPLSPSGIEEFLLIAKRLAKSVDGVDCILTSPAVRTVQTAEILAQAFQSAEVIEQNVLLQGTPVKQVEKIFRKYCKQDRVLVVVGHENHFSQILSYLLTVEDADCLRFKKGGSALLQVQNIEGYMYAQLLWMITPKLMRSLGS
ncbi:MAG: histidine phosphatase family protein [Deltaproteobacteria bacterium]|nr:histidine phosphatase family protein [Deltaproteobacteria bacterium]